MSTNPNIGEATQIARHDSLASKLRRTRNGDLAIGAVAAGCVKVNGALGQHSALAIPVQLPMLRRPIISDIWARRVPPPSLEGPKGRPPPCPSLPTDRAPTLLPVGARSCFSPPPVVMDRTRRKSQASDVSRRHLVRCTSARQPSCARPLRETALRVEQRCPDPQPLKTPRLKLPGNCRFQREGKSVV
jgi:hypothetical protein